MNVGGGAPQPTCRGTPRHTPSAVLLTGTARASDPPPSGFWSTQTPTRVGRDLEARNSYGTSAEHPGPTMPTPEIGVLRNHGPIQVIEGHLLSLVRKTSQVRVLDRPSAGIQEFAASAQFSGIWLLEDRHGLGAPMGPHGAISITGVRESARGFRAAVTSVLGAITAGTVVIRFPRVLLSGRGRLAGGWLPRSRGSLARRSLVAFCR